MKPPRSPSLFKLLYLLDVCKYRGIRLDVSQLSAITGVRRSYIRTRLHAWLESDLLIRYKSDSTTQHVYTIGKAGSQFVYGQRMSPHIRQLQDAILKSLDVYLPPRRIMAPASLPDRSVKYVQVQLPGGGIKHIPQLVTQQPARSKRAKPGQRLIETMLERYKILMRLGRKVEAEKLLEELKETAAEYHFTVNVPGDI